MSKYGATAAIRKEALGRLCSGVSTRIVADLAGVVPETVRQWALRADIEYGRYRVQCVQRRRAIAKAYADGVDVQAIANHFGVHPRSVHKILRREGVPVRRKRLTDAERRQAAALYIAGHSLHAIAGKLGVTRPTIAEALERLAIPRRPAHRPRGKSHPWARFPRNQAHPSR